MDHVHRQSTDMKTSNRLQMSLVKTCHRIGTRVRQWTTDRDQESVAISLLLIPNVEHVRIADAQISHLRGVQIVQGAINVLVSVPFRCLRQLEIRYRLTAAQSDYIDDSFRALRGLVPRLICLRMYCCDFVALLDVKECKEFDPAWKLICPALQELQLWSHDPLHGDPHDPSWDPSTRLLSYQKAFVFCHDYLNLCLGDIVTHPKSPVQHAQTLKRLSLDSVFVSPNDTVFVHGHCLEELEFGPRVRFDYPMRDVTDDMAPILPNLHWRVAAQDTKGRILTPLRSSMPRNLISRHLSMSRILTDRLRRLCIRHMTTSIGLDMGCNSYRPIKLEHLELIDCLNVYTFLRSSCWIAPNLTSLHIVDGTQSDLPGFRPDGKVDATYNFNDLGYLAAKFPNLEVLRLARVPFTIESCGCVQWRQWKRLHTLQFFDCLFECKCPQPVDDTTDSKLDGRDSDMKRWRHFDLQCARRFAWLEGMQSVRQFQLITKTWYFHGYKQLMTLKGLQYLVLGLPSDPRLDPDSRDTAEIDNGTTKIVQALLHALQNLRVFHLPWMRIAKDTGNKWIFPPKLESFRIGSLADDLKQLWDELDAA